MNIKDDIAKWFANHITEYSRDDLTKACEDCAHDLDHDEWLDDPEHLVWEIGLEWFKGFE